MNEHDHVDVLLRALQRRLGFLAIPQLTLLLLIGQGLTLILYYMDRSFTAGLLLQPDLVLAGQWWRLISFLFLPVSTNPLFAFFAFYFLYLQGRTLEVTWGAFRYTVFIAVGWLATAGAAWLTPHVPSTNVYLIITILLAFAVVAPDFEFLLFFVLPVKMKHFALAIWILLGLQLLASVFGGHWQQVVALVAALGNYFLFFGQHHYQQWHNRQRRVAFAAKAAPPKAAGKAWHTCVVCGSTEVSAPHEDFRVCSQCTGGKEYCTAHRTAHEHS